MSNPRLPVFGEQVTSLQTNVTYTIGAPLGQGGFGYAFYCEDSFGNELVAKVLKPERPKPEVESDWLKELELLVALRHPGVVHVYDYFEYEMMYYIIMERAEGSVRQMVASHGPLNNVQLKSFAGRLFSALHFIHLNNVIHRDFHIDNVLYKIAWKAGELYLHPKVTDFGISKWLSDADGGRAYTQIGRQYDVAPELRFEGHTSHRSDIYQAGLVLFYAASGMPALSAADGSVLEAIRSGIARQRAEALQHPASRSIAMMLRRRPQYRCQDALHAWRELSADLTP